MKTYRISSTPMIHSPGVFAWITQSIMPFDTAKAIDLFNAMGLPLDVCNAIVNGLAICRVDGEIQIVEVPN